MWAPLNPETPLTPGSPTRSAACEDQSSKGSGLSGSYNRSRNRKLEPVVGCGLASGCQWLVRGLLGLVDTLTSEVGKQQ